MRDLRKEECNERRGPSPQINAHLTCSFAHVCTSAHTRKTQTHVQNFALFQEVLRIPYIQGCLRTKIKNLCRGGKKRPAKTVPVVKEQKEDSRGNKHKLIMQLLYHATQIGKNESL